LSRIPASSSSSPSLALPLPPFLSHINSTRRPRQEYNFCWWILQHTVRHLILTLFALPRHRQQNDNNAAFQRCGEVSLVAMSPSGLAYESADRGCSVLCSALSARCERVGSISKSEVKYPAPIPSLSAPPPFPLLTILPPFRYPLPSMISYSLQSSNNTSTIAILHA